MICEEGVVVLTRQRAIASSESVIVYVSGVDLLILFRGLIVRQIADDLLSRRTKERPAFEGLI